MRGLSSLGLKVSLSGRLNLYGTVNEVEGRQVVDTKVCYLFGTFVAHER